MKWKRTGWAVLVVRIEEMRNLYRSLVRKTEGKAYSENVGVDGRVMLTWSWVRRFWAFINTGMELRILYKATNLIGWTHISFWRRSLLHGVRLSRELWDSASPSSVNSSLMYVSDQKMKLNKITWWQGREIRVGWLYFTSVMLHERLSVLLLLYAVLSVTVSRSKEWLEACYYTKFKDHSRRRSVAAVGDSLGVTRSLTNIKHKGTKEKLRRD